MLNDLPKSQLKVLVLWTPVLAQDSRAAAQNAAALMPDSRVVHYWDLWSYGSRLFAKQLQLPLSDAWDMLCVYKPYLSWDKTLPEPTFWMQRRHLKVGEPFDKEKLEERLRDLLTPSG